MAKSFDISIIIINIIIVGSCFLILTNETDSSFSELVLFFWLLPNSSRLSDVGS